MSDCFRSFGRVVLAMVVVILACSPLWAQVVVSPRAPSAGADPGSPISPFLFGPPAYPFRATAPSSFGAAPLPVQTNSGIYRGPSLSSTSPPPVSSLTHSMHSQPNLGAFVGFAPLSSLSLTDAALSLPGGTYRPATDNSAHSPCACRPMPKFGLMARRRNRQASCERTIRRR